jgi:hypothetical protein
MLDYLLLENGSLALSDLAREILEQRHQKKRRPGLRVVTSVTEGPVMRDGALVKIKTRL